MSKTPGNERFGATRVAILAGIRNATPLVCGNEDVRAKERLEKKKNEDSRRYTSNFSDDMTLIPDHA